MNMIKPLLPESVFVDHFEKSKLYSAIDSLFLSRKFKIALSQDIYAIVYYYWKNFMMDDENNDTPEYIKVFDADKVINKTLNDLFEDIYPNKELELFEKIRNIYVSDDTKDESDKDFCLLLTLLVLNSGFVKKVLKRSYKTVPMELKEELIRVASSKFLDLCADAAAQNHPDFPGVRPLNALEAKRCLYDEDFISSFKIKRRRK